MLSSSDASRTFTFGLTRARILMGALRFRFRDLRFRGLGFRRLGIKGLGFGSLGFRSSGFRV